MKDSDSKLLGCIGGIVAVLFILIVGTFANGLTLSVLWKWFVVPAFDVPQLTVMQALGLSLVVSFFTADLQKQEADHKKKTSATESILTACLQVVIKPLVFLAIGWVYLQFM